MEDDTSEPNNGLWTLFENVFENGHQNDANESGDHAKEASKKIKNQNLEHASYPENKDLQKDKDKEQTCTICNGTFIYREFNKHKTSADHRRAKRRLKQMGQRITPMVPAVPLAQVIASKHAKEEYYFREYNKYVNLPQQVEQYQKVLTTFLSLRFCLNSENKDVKISMNNRTWNLFGDIVIEIVDQEDRTVIEAIQCKKIQNRNDMSTTAVTDDKGKLSLIKHLDELATMQRKRNYQNTFFKLFTLSKWKVGSNTVIPHEQLVKNWKNEEKKQLWKDRKLLVTLFLKNNPVNTTDDPDNILIFKILDEEGKIVDEVEKDLCKFSLFMNQRKILSLKHLITMIIEDKFGSIRDITEQVIKFFSEHFNFKSGLKSLYKLTKRDVLLKIAEFLLIPYMLLSENTVEGNVVDLWHDTLERFDIVVVKNQSDTINKIYKSINGVLRTKIDNIDNIMKTYNIDKSKIQDETLTLELFDSSEDNSRKVSLSDLYIALWKVELTPLVLVVENEESLALIIKVINFLHGEKLPLKFILATNKDIHPSYLPEQLRTFTNLEDLGRIDKEFLDKVLDGVTIPFLNFSVKLRDIVGCNSDFLAKVTPETLLNMAFEDYAFKNIVVPLTDDIIDNTLVFNDEIMKKIQSYFWNEDRALEVKNLSYVVNVDGCPTRLDVPPDI